MSNLTLEQATEKSSILLENLIDDVSSEEFKEIKNRKKYDEDFLKNIYDYSDFAEIKSFLCCDYDGKEKTNFAAKISQKYNNSGCSAFFNDMIPGEKIILEKIFEVSEHFRKERYDKIINYITNYARRIAIVINYNENRIFIGIHQANNFWLPKQFIELIFNNSDNELVIYSLLNLMKTKVDEFVKQKYYDFILRKKADFIEEKNKFEKYCDEMLKKIKPIEEMELEQKKIKQEKELIKIARKHLKQEKEEIMEYREQLENERVAFEEYKTNFLTQNKI